MNVADIMTVNPITIQQGKSVAYALEVMQSIHCHHLPVLSQQGHLIGILSEYDCQRAIAARTKTDENGASCPDEREIAESISIYEVMTPAPIVVEPNMPAHDAARLMLTNNIRSLPVMRGETLIGIVTTSDLLIAFMQVSERPRLNAG